MTTTYSPYNEAIREACDVDAAEAATIENVLRADPSYSTLDHLTRRQLVRAAREARDILGILREESPEIAAWYAEGSAEADVLIHDGVENPRGSRAGFQFRHEAGSDPAAIAERISERAYMAYAYSEASYRAVARFLLKQGFSPAQTEWIMDSKHMRWAYDADDGRTATSGTFRRYYAKAEATIRRDLAAEGVA